MSELLSPERLGELEEALQGVDSIEATEEVSPEDHGVEAAPESEVEDTSDETDVPPEMDAGETEDGHSVPYSRFSKVIAARNQYADEVSDLRAKIESLQNQAPQQRQAEPEPSYSYDDDSFEESEYNDDPRFSALHGQMREIAVAQEEVKLERELAQVQEEFPSVEAEFLLNAVIQDPETDIRQLAQEYTIRVAEIEEGAVARYLEQNPGAAAAASSEDVPPEVAARTQGSQRGDLKQNEMPTTMAEAHTALEQWLSNQ